MDVGSISLIELLGLMKMLGVPGVLLLGLVGFIRRWWVVGWYYDRQEEQLAAWKAEADQWREVALFGTGLAERATDHISRGRTR